MKMYINKFKLEFETTEIIKITNSGNARAYFKWLPSPNDTKLFTISPNIPSAPEHTFCGPVSISRIPWRSRLLTFAVLLVQVALQLGARGNHQDCMENEEV